MKAFKKKKIILLLFLIFIFLFLFENLTKGKVTELQYDANGYILFQEDYKTSEIISFKELNKEIPITNYTDFLTNLQSGKVSEIYAEFDQQDYASEFYYYVDNNCYRSQNPFTENFKENLLEKNVKIYAKSHIFERRGLKTPTYELSLINLLSNILNIGVSILIVYYLLRIMDMSGGGVKKKEAHDLSDFQNIKSFDEIGGLKEVKTDLLNFVDFIKNPEKYEKRGAKLPSGVLLVGEPGTGKTMLARAIAKETNVNFLYANSSDFIEMIVGMGASRIRTLFKEARKTAPCIIFIDEIDALCRKRGEMSSHSEDRQTLTALLTEMDGFEKNSNIMVIAATNRLEDIDKAILRPGRFDEIFYVPMPETMEERMEIIKIYSKDKKFGEDVDFEVLSKELFGYSPAEIEAVLNEAAIISVQKGLHLINKDCLEEAIYKRVMKGHQKNNSSRSQQELKIVAYHEAGHALMALLNQHEVTKITILPSTSGAGGVTFVQPDEHRFYTKKMLENEICELYAGAAAEYLLNGSWDQVSNGCSNDIEKATILLKNMVEKFGMSDYGLISMTVLNPHTTEKETREEILKIGQRLKDFTIQQLKIQYDDLTKLANELMKKETLYKKDIEQIIENQVL